MTDHSFWDWIYGATQNTAGGAAVGAFGYFLASSLTNKGIKLDVVEDPNSKNFVNLLNSGDESLFISKLVGNKVSKVKRVIHPGKYYPVSTGDWPLGGIVYYKRFRWSALSKKTSFGTMPETSIKWRKKIKLRKLRSGDLFKEKFPQLTAGLRIRKLLRLTSSNEFLAKVRLVDNSRVDVSIYDESPSLEKARVYTEFKINGSIKYLLWLRKQLRSEGFEYWEKDSKDVNTGRYIHMKTAVIFHMSRAELDSVSRALLSTLSWNRIRSLKGPESPKDFMIAGEVRFPRGGYNSESNAGEELKGVKWVHSTQEKKIVLSDWSSVPDIRKPIWKEDESGLLFKSKRRADKKRTYLYVGYDGKVLYGIYGNVETGKISVSDVRKIKRLLIDWNSW